MPTAASSERPAATVVVVCGGDAPAAASLPALVREPGVYVVAADWGVDVARALGLVVDVAVGDFDSVSVVGLSRARSQGAEVDPHPAAKDETDLELALRCAVDRQPERIVVVGGGGGRLDHLLGNVALLAAPFMAHVDVSACLPGARLTVIRPGRDVLLCGAPGDLLSLLPVHGLAVGVVTAGLRFALRHEDLPAGCSRGLSNVFDAATATVAITGGVLLAIQPTAQPQEDRT